MHKGFEVIIDEFMQKQKRREQRQQGGRPDKRMKNSAEEGTNRKKERLDEYECGVG